MKLAQRSDLPGEIREWLHAVMNRLQVMEDYRALQRNNRELAELREQMAAMSMNSG